MKNKYIFIIILILLWGCKKNINKSNDDLPSIYPLELSNVTKLDQYIDSIQIIPLETTEKSYITHIRKMLITPTGNFIIQDPGGIFAFDNQGKYLFSFGAKGRGPGEYVGVFDICITNDQKYLLALANIDEVLKYSLNDGKFIEKLTPQLPKEYPNFDAICPAKGGGYFLFAANPIEHTDFTHPFYCMLEFDKTGKMVNKMLMRKDFIFSIGLITQSHENDYLIRPLEGDKICYKVDQGEIKPYVKIDFKDKSIPTYYIFDSQKQVNTDKYMFSDYYKVTIYLHETKEILYFSFCGPRALENYCLFSLSKNKGIRWERNQQDITPLFSVLASDSNYFYGIYNDYENNYTQDQSQTMEPLKKIIIENSSIQLGEDNPYIVKFKVDLKI